MSVVFQRNLKGKNESRMVLSRFSVFVYVIYIHISECAAMSCDECRYNIPLGCTFCEGDL
jgi:hypothetical protein